MTAYVIICLTILLKIGQTSKIKDPSFVSKWIPIESGKPTVSEKTIEHGFGKYPAHVLVEVQTSGGLITYSAGSAEIDDDAEPDRYGGVLCLYNSQHILISVPQKLGGIFFSGGSEWIGPMEKFETIGSIRIKAWSRVDFPAPSFRQEWTKIDVQDASTSFHEIAHGLGRTPDLVIVQVRGPDKSDYIYEAQGLSSVIDRRLHAFTQVCNVLFGFSDTAIRIWSPIDNEEVTACLTAANDGWGTKSVRYDAGYFRVRAWILDEIPIINISQAASNMDFSQPYDIKDQINEDITKQMQYALIQIQVEPKDGQNVGYRFYAIGTSMNEGTKDEQSGLVFGRNNTNIYLWRPKIIVNGGDTTTSPSIFHRCGLWKTNGVCDKTNYVDIRILVWNVTIIGPRKCPVRNIPSYENMTNSIVTADGNGYNAVMTLTCRPNYIYVQGDTLRRCLRDGSWNFTEDIVCEGITCTLPEDPVYGTVLTTGNRVGDVAEYKCMTGYLLKDPTTQFRTCQNDTTWTGNEPVCEAILCPELGHTNASINISGFHVNDKVQYMCSEGFRLNDPSNSERMCQINSTWTGADPYCEACCTCPVEESILELLKQLRKELIVDRKSTSKAMRGRISVYEDRPVAKGLGSVGLCVLLLVVMVIVIPDIPRLCADVKQAFEIVRKRFER